MTARLLRRRSLKETSLYLRPWAVEFQLGSDDDSFIYVVMRIDRAANPGVYGVTNIDFTLGGVVGRNELYRGVFTPIASKPARFCR